MGVEHIERREADQILSTALDDPSDLSGRDLGRALELLGSDEKRARVGSAWVFGVVAADSPARITPHLPQIAELLEDPNVRPEAVRALAYVGRSNPEAIERELEGVDEELARRCRQILWGQFVPKTVVRTAENRDSGEGASMGRVDGDNWGWLGGGSTGVYDGESDADRRRPPTDRPIDPLAVEYEYDQYTPVETVYRGSTVDTFKVVYRSPDGRTNAGLFKRFSLPEASDFPSAFDRRVAMWQSLDDHESVLPVVDWGTEPEPWVVTAYEDATGVAGLGRSGRVREAVWTLRKVADALCFAHRHGVVHGGLTPGAIVRSSIISEPDAWRYPRVTDWGYVGRLLADGSVPAERSERYLAPEHQSPERFGTIDGSTDVYGFGAVAYEALLGRAPFERGDDPGVGTLRADPTALDDRLTAELDAFFARCLARRKPERFETVQTMRAAFRRATGEFGD